MGEGVNGTAVTLYIEYHVIPSGMQIMVNRRILLIVAGWLILLAGAATAANFRNAHLFIETTAGERIRFNVEIAETPEQRGQGLMFRESLAADSGMLFDFGRTTAVGMWMKNTLIPLDMLFIEGDGRIVAIAQNTIPYSENIIEAPAPVRAILELNGGTAARLGIASGDQVVFELFNGE